MQRFKKIMTTTDLSAESFAAVQYAAHLAKDEGSALMVLHVPHSISLAYTDFHPPVDMADIELAIERSAIKQLEGWVKRHLHTIPDVETRVVRGVTDDVICDEAKKWDASVIVMATHGRRGLGHLFIGSVTERVIRSAPCPVLVVRPPASAGSVEVQASST